MLKIWILMFLAMSLGIAYTIAEGFSRIAAQLP